MSLRWKAEKCERMGRCVCAGIARAWFLFFIYVVIGRSL